MATEGCHVQFWEDTNYNDNSIIVHGPAEHDNMRNLPDANGYNWGDQIGSLMTGPKCWLIAYADENYADTSIVVGPDSQIPDLADLEDDIDSIKLLDHAP